MPNNDNEIQALVQEPKGNEPYRGASNIKTRRGPQPRVNLDAHARFRRYCRSLRETNFYFYSVFGLLAPPHSNVGAPDLRNIFVILVF